ncbi:MAG: D-tyrosyl-tRNA(Tyr) deacylase [Anaerolineae bacterium]|nr:D-tyrosyl-tRNA(Tyr) deacylase [Phycisphaerae bacterium]
MIAVVQRVTSGRVTIDDRTVGEIEKGLVVLAAVERNDTDEKIRWMAEKLIGLRIFRSAEGGKHFDQDVKQIGGSILLVSNFTVAAATRRGRRPSLDGAADPEAGRVMFNRFVDVVKSLGVPVATGKFGADMIVSIDNDGPATFIVQTDRD